MTEKYAVKHALLCEDARMEGNGKQMLIGIYARSIGLTNIPTRLTLVLALALEIKTPFSSVLETRVTFEGQQLAHLQGALSTEEVGPALIPIPMPAFTIGKAGTLTFEVKLTEEKSWVQVLSAPVEVGPDPTANRR